MQEEFVSVYLRNLARRPRMYAHTNEAFVRMVETLLDVLRIPGGIGRRLLREGSCGADTTTQLTDVFARRVIEQARICIAEEPRCPLCNRLAGDSGICSHGIHQCQDCEWDNGTCTKACWIHREEEPAEPVEVDEELAAGIESVIEAELTEVFKFGNLRLLAMFPGFEKGKNQEERRMYVRASVRQACDNRYANGICKLCGGSALLCVPKHAKGESCASPPRTP